MMAANHGSKTEMAVTDRLDATEDAKLPLPSTLHASTDGISGVAVDTEMPAQPETDDQCLFRLGQLTPLEYDRVRKSEAKKLGVQVSTLDNLVEAARTPPPPVKVLPYEDFEPWAEPIDLSLLLTKITDTIRSLVILEPQQADAAALWVAQTYVTEHAEIAPVAIINAPEKACAKSLLQGTLAKMSKRPLQASNASLSAMFRAVESWQSTLFIDEADTFFKENPELHGVINAGFAKGGFVLRSESTGDSFEPRMFSVYGPKSIAGIALEKHLPDSTMSRGIHFNLRRKLPHESVLRMREFDKSIFGCICSQLVRFAQDYGQQVGQARPHLPEELSDRQQDCWEPLLAIAQIAGPEWATRALDAALMMSTAADDAVSTSNELLADIQFVFEAKKTFKLSTVELIEALTNDAEKGWATYNHGKHLSPRQLAKHLATYGIQPKTVRMPNGSTPKGYDADQFADAFARYLAAPEKLPQRRNAATQGSQHSVGEVADTLQPPGSEDSAASATADDPRPIFELDGASQRASLAEPQAHSVRYEDVSDPGGLDAFLADLDRM